MINQDPGRNTMKAHVPKFETLIGTALAVSAMTTFAVLLNAMFSMSVVA